MAIDSFQQLNDIRPEAALTGICAGFVQLKKPQAKNQLKRLSQAKWTSANFEHLERGYLILGKISLSYLPCLIASLKLAYKYKMASRRWRVRLLISC